MLIFSKNRPFFISNYLDSLSGQPILPTVLCYVDHEYKDAYDKIQRDFPSVKFIDVKAGSTVDIIMQWTNDIKDDLAILSVDDNLCLTDFSEEPIRKAMSDPSMFGFSLRLMNGIRNIYIKPNADGILVWDPRKYVEKHSFGYYWEVSSTVYRVKTIQDILRQCNKGVVKPNHIEAKGMHVLRGKVSKLASFEYAPIVNVFVDTHRIVDLEYRLTDKNALSIYWEGKKLDKDAYSKARDRVRTMHIMELHLV